MIEFNKANDDSGPPSPNVQVRKAQCHQKLGDLKKALSIVEEAVTLYPEHSLVLATLGEVYESKGESEKALASWKSVHELNPYDLSTQEALIRLYQQQGRIEKAEQHKRYAQILSTGGAIYTGDSNAK